MKEIFKPVKDFEGFYEVSNFGRVKSLGRKVLSGKGYGAHAFPEKLLKPIKNGKGYYQVSLYKNIKQKIIRINRLVAVMFIPNPNNYPFVCHNDDDPENNRADNLFWGTAKMNSEDMVAKGRKFTKSIGRKLNEKQVRVIKHCINFGMNDNEIAKYFPVGRFSICEIRIGRTWKNVTI